MYNTRFIIFEKSFLIRLGLISLIKEIKDIEIYGDYNSTDSFLSIIKSLNPNIVIINSELYKEIKDKITDQLLLENKFKIIQISNSNNNFSSENTIYYEEEKAGIINKINSIIQQTTDKNKHHEKGNNEISNREKAILACVAKGLTNKEIAEELFISTHTVITHRKNIVRKLGIKTVSGLTVYAILNKIIDMSDLQQL